MIALQSIEDQNAIIGKYSLPVITSNFCRPRIYYPRFRIKEVAKQGFAINNKLSFTITINDRVIKITISGIEVIEITSFITL